MPEFQQQYQSGNVQDLMPIDAIHSFQRQVDSHLPGMYVWFSDESLHITLRALA